MNVQRFQRNLLCCSIVVFSSVCMANTIPQIVAQAKPAIIQVIACDQQWESKQKVKLDFLFHPTAVR